MVEKNVKISSNLAEVRFCLTYKFICPSVLTEPLSINFDFIIIGYTFVFPSTDSWALFKLTKGKITVCYDFDLRITQLY